MPDVPGWPAAFRGSAAVAAGLVTRHMLRGPRFVRLFPDTYIPTPVHPPDLALRSLAAYRYLDGRGALSGYSDNLVEAVVAVDALANFARFNPDLLLHFAARYARSRGNGHLAEVVAHSDRKAGSPMETRLRLIILAAGLPRPHSQWVVQDPHTRTAIWLDLAYPDDMIGIEYEGDGEVHATT